MLYDQAYYEHYWGTVHRHDYVENWVSNFKDDYRDVKSILDVGTGCGYMVKRLREEGYDAWGTEISQYALDNSCAPGFVCYGDATDLPFKEGRFDLVFSSGLLADLEEADVFKAVREFHRVGRRQRHNVDHDKCLRLPDFKTWKPLEWWNEILSPERVLVACPTHITKDYCFQQWVNVVKNLTYPNYEVFVVDNSQDGNMKERYGIQLPIVHLDTGSTEKLVRIDKSMRLIQEKFLSGIYTKWFNLECDVIPGTQILEVLMKHKYADWVGHAYNIRGHEVVREYSSGIGCTLLARRILEEFDFANCHGESPDAWLWEQVQQANIKEPGKYKTIELYGHCPIRHVDG